MAETHIVTVRLTPEQHEWLRDEAEVLDESVSWVLRDLIDQAMMDSGVKLDG